MESSRKILVGSFKLAELQSLKNGRVNYPFQCNETSSQEWELFLWSINRERHEVMSVQFGADDLLTEPGQPSGILATF